MRNQSVGLTKFRASAADIDITHHLAYYLILPAFIIRCTAIHIVADIISSSHHNF